VRLLPSIRHTPSNTRPAQSSAILIRVAQLGYARAPEFDLYAPRQPDMRSRAAWAARHVARVRVACTHDGLDPDAVAGAWDGRSRRGGRVRQAGIGRGGVRAKL
jgi:coenzyme A diphosphatase NUDT7